MFSIESLKMFESKGFRNLIKDFKIPTTRNEYAWKHAFEKRGLNRPYFGKQLFADYVFVSPEVKVNKFEVSKIEISDHLPMILDFEI